MTRVVIYKQILCNLCNADVKSASVFIVANGRLMSQHEDDEELTNEIHICENCKEEILKENAVIEYAIEPSPDIHADIRTVKIPIVEKMN